MTTLIRARESSREDLADRMAELSTGAMGIRGSLTCEVRDFGGDEPVMDFIASDGSLDRYNEVIEPEAWDLGNYRRNPVVVDCHDYSSVCCILGRADETAVVDGKLLNRVRFALDNPAGNLAYKLARGGFIKSQSVGFMPIEWTNGNGREEPSRTYTKAELLEISLVVVPANPGATIGAALRKKSIHRADLVSFAKFIREFFGESRGTANGGEVTRLRQWEGILAKAL